jgi:hypothetical protein
LVQLKRYLSSHIHYDMRRLHDPRPWLRQTAETTLRTRHGFCGETARVAIRLLLLAGIRANRLYLEGERWKHTLVEHDWEGGLRIFDAFPDPGTLLPDDGVGRIDSRSLAEYPNAHLLNPYRLKYRIKVFHRVPALRRFEQWRLPGAIVGLLETPSAIRCLLALMLTLGGAVWLAMN